MVMRQSVTMSAAATAAQHSSAKHVDSSMAHPAGSTGMASGPSVTLERRGGRFSQVSSSFDAAASKQRRLWSRPAAACGTMVENTRPSGCRGLQSCNSHVWGRSPPLGKRRRQSEGLWTLVARHLQAPGPRAGSLTGGKQPCHVPESRTTSGGGSAPTCTLQEARRTMGLLHMAQFYMIQPRH